MLTKLVRIGRDAELRNLSSGTSVLSFPAVYDIGYGDNKKSQWIDCIMFGQRAEKLAQYFSKGKQIVIYATDVCVETWDKKDGSGQGHKLCCRLQDFDFASSQSDSPQSSSNVQPTNKIQPAPIMDDLDDDIPF